MARKIVQTHTRNNKPAISNRPQITNNIVVQNIKRTIVQGTRREAPKLPNFSSQSLLNQIRGFTRQPEKNYYLGFGGLGDALLLMAACWDDPKARVVFFANQIPFIRSFFEIFGISVYLHDNIMGTQMASHIYDLMKALPSFKTSAHLADGLNHNDWSNESKYTSRIIKSATWIKHLGKEQFDKPVIIIAPSGSSKDIKRQRYLHHHEYNQLVEKYLNSGYRVYATGSTSDLHHFKLIDKEDFYWLCLDKIYKGNGTSEEYSLRNLLRIINSAEQIISMDTWLKTYTLLCGIPTTVIKTRWDNKYRSFGEDITDWIFLNPKMWPEIKISKIEDLLASF